MWGKYILLRPHYLLTRYQRVNATCNIVSHIFLLVLV